MTFRELQLHVCKLLNADATLVQGRCKAFAEDALDARLAPEPALHAGAGGLAIVVRTPSARLAGALPAAAGIPVSATLAVDCIEIPAVHREQTPSLSAMGAAERVAHFLHDGRTVTFDRFESDLVRDGVTRYYVFTAYFEAHITHTQPS